MGIALRVERGRRIKPLSGMNSMEQVVENIRVADDGIANSLGQDDLLMFDKLRKVMKTRIKADCTACRYCMPCASGVDIPEVLAALNKRCRLE